MASQLVWTIFKATCAAPALRTLVVTILQRLSFETDHLASSTGALTKQEALAN